MGGQSSRGENAYGIEIVCKDLRTIKLAFKQEAHSRRALHDVLSKYCFPQHAGDEVNFFAYSLRPTAPGRGWQLYNIRNEFERQARAFAAMFFHYQFLSTTVNNNDNNHDNIKK
jgi:myotubularin-related protein 1/2